MSDQRRLKPFAYLNADKTPLYRAMMRLFAEAKTHFEIHLRSAEVVAGLHDLNVFDRDPTNEVEQALLQLCDWGNLKRTQDTSDVRTVEEFYQPRYLYQLTREGEAAEQAVLNYEENVRKSGELRTAALGVIRDQLQTLATYAGAAELDTKKVHLTLSTLKIYFDQLTTKAQVFIGSLQRAIDLHGYELDVFIAYKEKLIDYLERFVGELVIAAGEIADAVQKVERVGVGPLLRGAAEHDLIDAMDSGAEAVARTEREWRLRWTGLKKWFIGDADSPSQADTLRGCARSAIPALLVAISGFHDRRMAGCDRPTDLKMLARWFAQTTSDADAHRLWRVAFGLNPARHLRIDDDTLTERDQRPIPTTTPWVEAPPVLVSHRLRKVGQQHRHGRPANVIDRSLEKRRLAALAVEEMEQIERARRRLATGRAVRLSELGVLDQSEFRLFLELLGKVLTEQKAPGAEVVTSSIDGSLRIDLKPTEDGETATIVTSAGVFQGRDYYIRITDLVNSDHPAAVDDSRKTEAALTDKRFQPVGLP